MRNNLSKALQIQLKAWHLSEELNDPVLISLSFLWLGVVYEYSHNFDKALYYYNKWKSNKEIYEKNQELVYASLGNLYLKLNRMDSALFYIQKAYIVEIKEKNRWCGPYLSMAAISEEKLNNLSNSIFYYRRALKITATTT
jgi:tetratricopeptide (TPR) repeat protein